MSKTKIDLQNLENFISNGTWNYSYSFKNDSCFVLNDLLSLSKSFTFRDTNNINQIKEKYPRLYTIGKDKLLFGMICYVSKKNSYSYPLVNTVSKDTTTLLVTHYGILGGTYGEDYFIKKITKDTMVISNKTLYNIGSKKISNIYHVYLKNNS